MKKQIIFLILTALKTPNSFIILLSSTGIGYGQMLATIMVVTYYCSLMALVGFYFVQSFAAELPWATCSEEWDNCFDSKMADHNSSNTVNLTGRTSSSELYF
jgi:hypothetical protein